MKMRHRFKIRIMRPRNKCDLVAKSLEELRELAGAEAVAEAASQWSVRNEIDEARGDENPMLVAEVRWDYPSNESDVLRWILRGLNPWESVYKVRFILINRATRSARKKAEKKAAEAAAEALVASVEANQVEALESPVEAVGPTEEPSRNSSLIERMKRRKVAG